MKNHSSMIRGFSHFGGAWYGRKKVLPTEDRINVGFYSETSGGTTGEFAITWVDLGSKLAPRIECFSDAWDAITHFQDFLAALAEIDNTDPTPVEVCEILRRLGIKDLTKYNPPSRDEE